MPFPNSQIAGHAPLAVGILALTSIRPYVNEKLLRVVSDEEVYSMYFLLLRQSFLRFVDLRALRLQTFADILVQAGAVFLGPFPHFLHDGRGY